MPERHEVGRPDEVHGRGAHPDAAVAGRVVRDVVGSVDRDAAPEVLGPVELAELALPPAFGPLPVDLVQPVGGLGVALQDAPRLLLARLRVRVARAGRHVDRPDGLAPADDVQDLRGLVDLDQIALRRMRAGLGGHGVEGIGRRLVDAAALVGDVEVLLEGHDGLAGGQPVVPVGGVDPEAELQQAVLEVHHPVTTVSLAERLDREHGRRHQIRIRRGRRRGGDRGRRRGERPSWRWWWSSGRWCSAPSPRSAWSVWSRCVTMTGCESCCGCWSVTAPLLAQPATRATRARPASAASAPRRWFGSTSPHGSRVSLTIRVTSCPAPTAAKVIPPEPRFRYATLGFPAGRPAAPASRGSGR